ncbi:MAG: MFS transporter [Solirubrobacterales bacterium]|nr:MFS transporter [Solirubrobacterales bacterium]MBV9810634.1 MFS transporter [Solirubrobacterales bacterium]
MSSRGTGAATRNLVLAAMVFAVAMTFIDQTIVAIAIPRIQKELSLSATGTQWVINGYLLALSALFAFGGKLGDVLGRRRMVLIGVTGFAIASAACGLTPKGSIAEAWIILFRVAQGATAALLFPAAVAIVVASFPLRERGKAMAIFFGISGGLTAIGPIAGGFLTQWTWRAIFWINIPVAIVALILTWMSVPDDAPQPQKLDYRGTALITGAMGLIVLGFEQSSVWGWSSVTTWACILIGFMLMAWFVRYELSIKQPLLRLQIFLDRAFATDTIILGLMSIVFVPFFFFGSVYSQVALGKTSSQAGEYILWFFVGFVIAAQVGGRILDRRGARPTVVFGGALGALGFFLLAGKLTDLSLGAQRLDIAIAGAGLGLMLGPASTDAVNRAPSTSYSEVTGITQTARNFGASLGLAVLGAILITRNDTNITGALAKHGVPSGVAHRVAASFGGSGPGAGGGAGRPSALVHDVQLAFAHSTQTVFYIMAGVMAVTFIIALRWLPSGRLEQIDEAVPAVPETARS